ncbi:amidohydrolase [Enterovibrio norvegicus FF-33]|uniref:amidohydrolase family protein n=1 Tax=Enterovibrio norvegicus TaxID=188144 RepID=UPI0002D7EFE3|nr:amidohydrolase family protein [Enterovibrio norvegicus]OEE70141.1 amidohydrolase [Enterovibrio norvegicus FF-33]
MQIIDPHLHLFDLSLGQYDWLRSGNAPHWRDKATIQRDFSDADLTLSAPHQLCGFVHVEAGFDNDAPWREIAWLESTCALPFKSIGCVDITLPPSAFAKQLAKLGQYQSLVGVRHILDSDAVTLLAMNTVHTNLMQIADAKLIFEAQFDAQDTGAVNAFIRMSNALPTLRLALNHAGFPPPEKHLEWDKNMKALAVLPSLSVKASGWEMSDRHYPLSTIQDRLTSLVTLFGEDRIMLASNFPLTLFRARYDELWHDYLSLPYSEALLTKLCNENARRFYGF